LNIYVIEPYKGEIHDGGFLRAIVAALTDARAIQTLRNCLGGLAAYSGPLGKGRHRLVRPELSEALKSFNEDLIDITCIGRLRKPVGPSRVLALEIAQD
jgi:hypothetical protein